VFILPSTKEAAALQKFIRRSEIEGIDFDCDCDFDFGFGFTGEKQQLLVKKALIW
jgi:hypothetical protein